MNRNSQIGLKGTPIHMAPEVLTNMKYSKAGDVYAFAYIVYEIFSSEKPFEGFGVFEIMKSIIEGYRPTINNDIPPAYRELIKRCWSERPEDRPSFDQIVDEFKNNHDFITELIDESKFYDYVDFIDMYQNTFDKSKLIHFDEFINGKPETDQKFSSSFEISPKSLFFDTSNFVPTNKKLSANGSSFETLIIKNRSNSSEYVAKIITNGLETGQDQQRFIKTSEILFDLNHPSIASLQGINFHSFRGIFKDTKTFKPTILTEYYPNGSLRTIFDRIKNKKSVKNWNPTKKLICILGLSHGMKTLHSKGVVHSNLKPENILIDKNFYPKISDIKISSEGKINVTFCTSPELFKSTTNSKGEEVGSEADVYSFAMIAYEVISENGPFSKNGKSFKISHLEKKILSKERPDLSSKLITSSMRDLISASWDEDPKKRPTFDQIYEKISSDYKSFIKENIDESEVKKYIQDLTNFEKTTSAKTDSSSEKVDPSSEKVKESSEKVDELTKVNEQQKQQIIQIQKEKDQQKQQIVQIQKEKDQQKQQIVQIQKEKDQQKQQIIQIQKEKDQQKQQIIQIQKEVEKLKIYISSLKEKNPTSIQFVDYIDYEEKSIIGEGATSNVKLVTKREEYAKKELKDLTHEGFKRFLTEGEILFLLRHPCIVRIHGINTGDETHAPSIYLSAEPSSLESSIKYKELNEHQKNRITVEVVLGMRYIHKHKFMHRDLKPPNILLSKNKHVRISDFGLAKEETLESSQTKGIGTMRFMAPELFEENNGAIRYTNKVDVYSFGVSLIYIITEKYPDFSLSKVVSGIPPKMPGHVVDWVHELIVKCLSRSPEIRPTFDEIFDTLKLHNYDLFNENKDGNLSNSQQSQKKEIENRILKIEAFEFQHQDD